MSFTGNSSQEPKGVSIKVMIPVRTGGFTGQRDAWEEYERDHIVSVSGSTVTLTSTDTSKKQVSFDKGTLEEALRALNVHSKPIYRGGSEDNVLGGYRSR